MSGERTDPGALLAVVGRLKVRELARASGMSVDALAGKVMRAAKLDALVLLDALEDEGNASAEPMLADLPGRATAAQVEAIVDRWVLGRALELHAGNVTHTAAWLKISRRQLRLRWAKVRALPATRSSMSGPPRGPAPPSLSDLLERRVGYREIRAAVGRWLIEGTLAQLGGNLSRSAAVLEISRPALRRRRRRGLA